MVPPQAYLRYKVAYLYSSKAVNTGNRDLLGKVVRAGEKTMDQYERPSVQTVECVTGVNCVALKRRTSSLDRV